MIDWLHNKWNFYLPATDDKLGRVGPQEHLLITGYFLESQADPFVLLLLGRQSEQERLTGSEVQLLVLALTPAARTERAEYLVLERLDHYEAVLELVDHIVQSVDARAVLLRREKHVRAVHGQTLRYPIPKRTQLLICENKVKTLILQDTKTVQYLLGEIFMELFYNIQIKQIFRQHSV